VLNIEPTTILRPSVRIESFWTSSSSSLDNCRPLSSVKLRAAVGVGELLGYKEEETNDWIVEDIGATVDDGASDGCTVSDIVIGVGTLDFLVGKGDGGWVELGLSFKVVKLDILKMQTLLV